ncbi:hypothetical protein pb186bvf_005353 [Paramecium bursaria]
MPQIDHVLAANIRSQYYVSQSLKSLVQQKINKIKVKTSMKQKQKNSDNKALYFQFINRQRSKSKRVNVSLDHKDKDDICFFPQSKERTIKIKIITFNFKNTYKARFSSSRYLESQKKLVHVKQIQLGDLLDNKMKTEFLYILSYENAQLIVSALIIILDIYDGQQWTFMLWIIYQNFPQNPKKDIESGFINVEQAYLDRLKVLDKYGCCSVLALVIDTICYISNKGDQDLYFIIWKRKINNYISQAKLIRQINKNYKNGGQIYQPSISQMNGDGMPNDISQEPDIFSLNINDQYFLILACEYSSTIGLSITHPTQETQQCKPAIHHFGVQLFKFTTQLLKRQFRLMLILNLSQPQSIDGHKQAVYDCDLQIISYFFLLKITLAQSLDYVSTPIKDQHFMFLSLAIFTKENLCIIPLSAGLFEPANVNIGAIQVETQSVLQADNPNETIYEGGFLTQIHNQTYQDVSILRYDNEDLLSHNQYNLPLIDDQLSEKESKIIQKELDISALGICQILVNA